MDSTAGVVMEDFPQSARRLQLELHRNYSPCEYDEYYISIDGKNTIDQRELLGTKICYLIYGMPDAESDDLYEFHYGEVDNEDVVPLFKMYTKDQQSTVIDLIEKILKLERPDASKLLVSFVFVVLKFPLKKEKKKSKGEVSDEVAVEVKRDYDIKPIPIMKILKSDPVSSHNCWYVDLDGRVYKNWTHYLKNNKLPKAEICYPTNGYYDVKDDFPNINISDEKSIMSLDEALEKLDLSFGNTPASSPGHTILHLADNVTTGVTLGALGIVAVSTIGGIAVAPVLLLGASAAGFTGMIYGSGRSVHTLVDRALHRQNIAPLCEETRAAWITIVGSAIGIGSAEAARALAGAASSAVEISMGAIYGVNALQAAAVGIGAAGITNGAYGMYRKYRDNNEISTLEVVQFSLSSLLFAHSIVNFKTSQQIIRDVQTATLDTLESSLDTRKSQLGFERMKAVLRDTEPDVYVRNKRIIRSFPASDKNRVEFFRKVYDLTRINNRLGLKNEITFGHNGGVLISGQEISHNTLLTMTPAQQTALLNDLSSVNSGNLTYQDFSKNYNLGAESNLIVDQRDEKKENFLSTQKMLKGLNFTAMNYRMVSQILHNIKDTDNLMRVLKLSFAIFEYFGFKKAKSYCGIIKVAGTTLTNVCSDLGIDVDSVFKEACDTIFPKIEEEINDSVVEKYLHQLNSEPKFAFTFETSESAIFHYNLYRNGRANPMNPREYWKGIQDFLSKASPQDAENSRSIYQNNDWYARCNGNKIEVIVEVCKSKML